MKKAISLLFVLLLFYHCTTEPSNVDNSSPNEVTKTTTASSLVNNDNGAEQSFQPSTTSTTSTTTDENQTVFNTWQVVSVYSGPPVGNGWEAVENGYILSILESNEFISSKFSSCSTGTIQLNYQEIRLNYRCTGFRLSYENPPGVFTYAYSFFGDHLELNPVSYACYEGCEIRLQKLE